MPQFSPRVVIAAGLAGTMAIAVPMALGATTSNAQPANKAVAAANRMAVFDPNTTKPLLTATFKTSNPEDLLNRARDGALQNVSGKVTSEKPLTMNGHPGKEFSGDGVSPEADSSGKHQEATFTARVFWVPPRLYQVLYVRPKTTSAPSENGQKFLDSFQLTGGK